MFGDLIRQVIHAVDEGDALTLILEGRVGESPPAAFLALLDVGWPSRLHWKS